MGKATPAVQIPGAPADQAGQSADDNTGAAGATGDAGGTGDGSQTGDDVAAELAARDQEIAQLRAQLAAKSAPAAPSLVMEADGPNSKRYRAESKHQDYTCAELDKLVRAGKVNLTDHHVLCKDGWYVNPQANAHANG